MNTKFTFILFLIVNSLFVCFVFAEECEQVPSSLQGTDSYTHGQFAVKSCVERCKGKNEFLRSVTCPATNPEACHSNAGSKPTDDMQAACSGSCRGGKSCKFKSYSHSSGPSDDGTVPDGTNLDIQLLQNGATYTVKVNGSIETDVPQAMGDGQSVSASSAAENKAIEAFKVLMWYVDVTCECQ